MKLNNIISEVTANAEFISSSPNTRNPADIKIVFRSGKSRGDVIDASQASTEFQRDAKQVKNALVKRGIFKDFYQDKVPEVDMKPVPGVEGGRSYILTSDDGAFIYKATYDKTKSKWNFSRNLD